jgi:murein DD-endopeptidase MepM/ murein hydrolase activator NlpD
MTESGGHDEDALPGLVPEPLTLAPTLEEETLFAAAASSPEPPVPPFFVYTVQEGDSVGLLASRFGLSPVSILWNNLDLENADFLTVGQQIRIPTSDGIIYEVRLGDTLNSIAERFGVTADDIVGFAANGLSGPDGIVENQTLFIPNGELPAPAETPVVEVPPPAPIAPSSPEPTTPAPASPPAPATGPSSAGFIWPTTGNISSYFGPSHPLGIDIDMYGRGGDPIYAAASGTVTFAGGNACCSYGLYVIINHGNGFETLYAHLGSISVYQGQWVEQGQILGYIGLTGYTTGYHLHFEVHLNGTHVNPLNYLP